MTAPSVPRPDFGASGLPAPFPYFGGKARVAAEVWRRFGNVRNYIEPFFGSGAVLLGRPLPFDGAETVNDACGFIANFWRAVRAAPETVAEWADWPVNEADLEARHYWLVTEGAARLERLLGDPEGFDAQVAGWWCWGASIWIGSGWCVGNGPWRWTGAAWEKNARATLAAGVHRQLPNVGHEGSGVHRKLSNVGDEGSGVHRKLSHVGHEGKGVHRKLPHVGDEGSGVHRRSQDMAAISRETTELGGVGVGVDVHAWFAALSARLRRVRVARGDWARVVTPAVIDLSRNGLTPTGVFLDPPYLDHDRNAATYSVDDGSIAAAVRDWAVAAGRDPTMRIALCGYEGHYEMPADWQMFRWKTKGGYGRDGSRGGTNRLREVIWFSPACIPPDQLLLL